MAARGRQAEFEGTRHNAVTAATIPTAFNGELVSANSSVLAISHSLQIPRTCSRQPVRCAMPRGKVIRPFARAEPRLQRPYIAPREVRRAKSTWPGPLVRPSGALAHWPTHNQIQSSPSLLRSDSSSAALRSSMSLAALASMASPIRRASTLLSDLNRFSSSCSTQRASVLGITYSHTRRKTIP